MSCLPRILKPASRTKAITRLVCQRTSRLIAVAALAFGSAATLTAQSRDRQAEGQALAAELRNQGPSEDLHTAGVLKMRDPSGQRTEIPFTMQTVDRGESWSVSYSTPGTPKLPGESLRVEHTVDQPSKYFLAKSERPGDPQGAFMLIRNQDTAKPFAGSDFWLCDLGMEFLHWPDQRILKSEMRKGRSCRVLESSLPSPPPGHYTRVLSWIDIEKGGILRAEAYGADKKLIKEFSIGSFEKVNKRYQLKSMEIRDEKTDTRTRLEFDFNVPE